MHGATLCCGNMRDGDVMAVKREEAESWVDALGQTYKPGDAVAVSIINDRSPRTVYGVVENIYLTDTRGERIMGSSTVFDPETGEYSYVREQSCGVKVRVLKRSRWGRGDSGSTTYKIPENITKLALTGEQLEAALNIND